MKTIFELDSPGTGAEYIKQSDCPRYSLKCAGDGVRLPEVSEYKVTLHYTSLSKRAYGVDDGFYPLGSCTMKYNPKLNEEAASLQGFIALHPTCKEEDAQGSLELMYELGEALKEITGMDAVSLQPAAGAHGEWAGLMLIRAYHNSRGDYKRKKILVPDSAHGTNPASAAMAGYEVVTVRSDEEKGVDLTHLKEVAGDDTAALMLTNPTTLGLFEKNIKEISKIVHDAGGLLYYDGANLNAIMGITRPGDMGFDVVHLNLHKTFSTPHGGGGPGAGPIGCKKALEKFLPSPVIAKEGERFVFKTPKDSIGKVNAFYGNFAVLVKAYAYILTLGADGLKEASEIAVLNANYLKKKLEDIFETEKGFCMHEFVLSLQKLKDETGVSALDVAKSLIDLGIHPPTMYFPLLVHEALMFEPTETATKEMLDDTADIMRELHKKAYEAPNELKNAPQKAQIKRPDEVKAARLPILRAKY